MPATQFDQPRPTYRTRPYQNDDDWRAVRDLLIAAYPYHAPDHNWELRRWEGSRFHNADLTWDPNWTTYNQLWETTDGELVALAHTEYGPGQVFFQFNPNHRLWLEAELLDWAEAHLAETTAEGQHKLRIEVYDYDAPRIKLLTERDYVRLEAGGVIRRLVFGSRPLPLPYPIDGYTLRPLHEDDADYFALADLLNAAFNRSIHSGPEVRNFARHAPSFRHDLHLVAVHEESGVMAAHVGVNFFAPNGYGLFEPVCTHPDHRQRGLAQSLMFDGLQRLKTLGAREVFVGTGDMAPANALYSSIGFTEAYKSYLWEKVW